MKVTKLVKELIELIEEHGTDIVVETHLNDLHIFNEEVEEIKIIEPRRRGE